MKVLFFDTESTALAASWGRLLCASFVDLSDGAYTFRYDKEPWRGHSTVDDKVLVLAIRDELERADVIVGWNSILHDVPLLNARLALHDCREVHVGTQYATHHVDLMWYAGGASMKIGGRKLETVARFFQVGHQKTPLDGAIWQAAAAGDHGAMDTLCEHCEFDTLMLQELWPHLAPFVKKVTFTLSEVWPIIEQIPSRRI